MNSQKRAGTIARAITKITRTPSINIALAKKSYTALLVLVRKNFECNLLVELEMCLFA